MKWLLVALLGLACSGDESTNTAKTAEHPEEKQATQHADDHAKGAEHAGMDHGKMEAGAHVGPVPEGAKVFFVSPKEGETVKSPFMVQMGVEGMEVKPAGEIQDGSGHHHIVIDADPVAQGTLVPADDQHKHFGKGQTETELTLPAGQHTLQLQFANGVHLSYGEQMRSSITITVE